MTTTQIMAAIRQIIEDHLEESDVTARVSMAGDMLSAFDLLGAAAPGFAVVLFWEGDSPVQSDPPVVTHHISVLVARAPGPGGRDADALDPTATPIADVVDDLRSCLLAATIADEDNSHVHVLDYQGTVPAELAGEPVSGYRMRFDLTGTAER